MSWWRTESSTLRLSLMASWYVGPVLFVAGLKNVLSLRIAAAVVCVFGITETVQLMARGVLGLLFGAISIAGHAAVWVPYAGKRRAPLKDTLLNSCALLLSILCIYGACNTWPYTLSPLTALGMGLALAAVV